MASSFENNHYTRCNLHRRSQPNGSVQKSRPQRWLHADIPLVQEVNRRQSLPANPSLVLKPVPSASKQGRKRRVSETTPGLRPASQYKRPRSEGDISTSRAIHFNPHNAGVAQLPAKSEERSLERVSQEIYDGGKIL